MDGPRGVSGIKQLTNPFSLLFLILKILYSSINEMNYIHIYLIAEFQPHLTFFDEN